MRKWRERLLAERHHYIYCTDPECEGCLPSVADLHAMGRLDLWAEMMRRCIAQTPSTKTRRGALMALLANDPEYRWWSFWKRKPNNMDAAGEDQ